VACASSAEFEAPEVNWKERMQEVAAEYKDYGRVDDLARWAPEDCRMPPPPLARVSAAEEESPHGRKLYTVFARSHASYPEGPHLQQIVVKEAWKPERVTDPEFHYDPGAVTRGAVSTEGKEFYPYAIGPQGTVYRATKPAGLFIMISVRKDSKDGANGWVYGTVDVEGVVTEYGKIASCIKCHSQAPYDGLFGLPDKGRWDHR